ncbi:MAG: hypothetical protein ABIS67_08410 [Candidatus Eisenbacteria bacterium]
MGDRELVYVWADGVYVKAGLEREKAALLVVIGALAPRSRIRGSPPDVVYTSLDSSPSSQSLDRQGGSAMKPEDVAFFVAGHPATFATAGEKPWKLLLEQQNPRPSMDGREVGMTMRFILPSLAPQDQHLDTDNLCEPVFSVVVNRVGWFRSGRPNITWWQASMAESSPTGCEIVVTSDGIPSVPADTPMIEGIYTGPLPRNTKEPDVANWARGLLAAQGVVQTSPGYFCYLGFTSSRANIGDVATGVVKS